MANSLTPMMQQYMEYKNEHQDELLFYRIGDFFEMFFDDAKTASRELGLTLTGRDGGLDERIPMCGVPYHAVDGYIAKLIKKGYRVAVCDQIEDPKLAKGLVKRAIVKIVTPGTALNESLLEDARNRFLVNLEEDDGVLCLALADVSTGECRWFTANGSERLLALEEQLFRLQPSEIIYKTGIPEWEELDGWLKNKLPGCVCASYELPADAPDFVKQHFGDIGLDPLVRETVQGLLAYLHATVMADLSQINRLERISTEQYMNLDATAIRNLELIRNMRDGGKKGTLLDVLDFTSTSMGSRCLRNWIECPILDIVKIRERQDAVEELAGNPELRDAIQDHLKEVFDLERILSRLEVGSANARDLVSLRASLNALPPLKERLQEAKAGLLQKLSGSIQLHQKIRDTLAAAIVDDPPFTIREGGMIRDGYDLELDELHNIARNNSAWMADFEQKTKAATGIKNLKVGYNKVFGYYIEVSKGQTSQVPPEFVRKQTLVNAERYIVPELKDFENKILSAKEKIESLEYYIFNQIRKEIREEIPEIQDTAHALARLDVLASLATAACKYDYHRPELNTRGEIRILDGRHPVVERLLDKEIFVPNNVTMNSTDERMIILTGPNMAGKSTYMRQVALLVLMTQMGSFIPARSADVCMVDRIFTRVGASDDLATGQSTFMVEMNEVAQILKYATRNSLIILDEVGRGTSTYDGMAIARAVMEYIQAHIKAKTLFATHYHELIGMENVMEGIKNYSVAIKERGNDIVFLRRIVRGGTDRSYGVHVARLAGLPKKVLERADELLQEYDSHKGEAAEAAPAQAVAEQPAAGDDGMGSLFASSLTDELLGLDVMSMTPIEAMNALFKLQQEAKKEKGM
ncbi:MAG: DNA mismatch repair protein MutS [Succiniclasticum sp.]|nr:DNA mismatch repair protein MutS [Succiniclasticum sp.]MEE3478559.1 DNA mismatch repair protein MutS [Succiniclasticum sp.]